MVEVLSWIMPFVIISQALSREALLKKIKNSSLHEEAGDGGQDDDEGEESEEAEEEPEGDEVE